LPSVARCQRFAPTIRNGNAISFSRTATGGSLCGRSGLMTIRGFATFWHMSANRICGFEFIARLTHLDYARAMAFVAVDEANSDTLGVVRLHTDASGEAGEYAILLRSDLKGKALGWALMQMIIEYARSRGLKCIYGQILHENSVMLKMCRELGFKVAINAEDRGIYDVTLELEGE
jgi:acetyltransferase